MGILRRNKKKEEEDVDELDSEDEKPEKSKQITPRKPRKKTPPKEWGKKERLWVLVVFVSTVLASGVLAMSARSWKLPGLPQIKRPSFPEISFLGSETIEIEANKDNLQMKEEIINRFSEITLDLSGVYGLYVVHLDDGFVFGVNQDELFEPASLNKLPVMMTSYRESEKGRLNLRSEYVLKNEDKIGGSGSLSSFSEGTIFTYQELLDRMGKESDNTSFGVMRDVLGMDVINRTITEIGMSNTSYSENTTTPRDIGIYFSRLYAQDLVNSSNSEKLLDSITNTQYESWIPEGVMDEVKISHKFGREVHVVNDAGIVFTDNPYVIVIMSKGIMEGEADRVFPEISKMIYEIESR